MKEKEYISELYFLTEDGEKIGPFQVKSNFKPPHEKPLDESKQ